MALRFRRSCCPGGALRKQRDIVALFDRAPESEVEIELEARRVLGHAVRWRDLDRVVAHRVRAEAHPSDVGNHVRSDPRIARAHSHLPQNPLRRRGGTP